MFNKSDDNVEKVGFIDKDIILKYVSEEDIFELVFGFKPKEFDYIASPFRKDKSPGCWFQYTYSGKLKFVDFGSQIYIRGKRMINIDCFDAVQLFFNLTNLYKTIQFIENHLIKGKKLPERDKIVFIERERLKTKILFDIRPFDNRDAEYYKRYEISSQNLVEDKVFAIRRFKIINSKKGDFSSRAYDLCYAHTDFEDGRVKLHRPQQLSKKRFLTTCNQNDIYGINSLPKFGERLLIKKSYKDYRVIKNQGINTIGFQNEGMMPTNDILLPICKRFKFITVFFDNDATGIESSQRIADHINSYFPGKANSLYLNPNLLQEGISDPSDLIYKKGKSILTQFLKQKNLL